MYGDSHVVVQVAELITGLGNLGCSSTAGEGQTLCVLSDSFNVLGNAAGLQASGDLPEVDVVKVRPARVRTTHSFSLNAVRGVAAKSPGLRSLRRARC